MKTLNKAQTKINEYINAYNNDIKTYNNVDEFLDQEERGTKLSFKNTMMENILDIIFLDNEEAAYNNELETANLCQESERKIKQMLNI